MSDILNESSRLLWKITYNKYFMYFSYLYFWRHSNGIREILLLVQYKQFNNYIYL